MNFIRNRSRTKLFTILKETKAISRFLFCGCKSYCGYFHERKRRNSEGRRRMERGKKKRTSVHVSALTSTRDERERYRISRGVGFPRRFSRYGDALFATFLIISSVFVARLSGMNGTLVATRRANSLQRWFDDRNYDRSKFSNLI